MKTTNYIFTEVNVQSLSKVVNINIPTRRFRRPLGV